MLKIKFINKIMECICYSDRWDTVLADSEIGGLVSFVARGGGMLVIHNGISLGKRDEFKSMTSA